MRVRFRRGSPDDDLVRDGVRNVQEQVTGRVILRFDDHKETIAADDHNGYSVSDV